MTLRQADILEYYLLDVDNVTSVKVYDRTQDAIIHYRGDRSRVIRALSRFRFEAPEAIALVPDAENTLIVTDSLAMGAITDSYTPGEAAVQALQAGCDVLLMPDGLADAYDAVLAAVQNGTLSEDRLDLSVNKILRMKAQFCA